MVVTADFKLYVTGKNDRGQLGLVQESGSKMGQKNTFTRVDCGHMKKKKVLRCSAGNQYSMIEVRGKKGLEYYSTGDYTFGKLGLGRMTTHQH